MSDIPYCFDYWFDKNNVNSESLLLCGLDSGTVGLFYFKKPVTQLFETPFKNDAGALKVFMQDLKSQHSKWVRYSCLTCIHTEMIRQVKYVPDNATIISSSGCPNSSLVISDIYRFKQTYVFKLPKGVECFDYKRSLNILVSGSADHNVQVWNPYMTSKPVAILRGHTTAIIGVVIHEGLFQIFSYSRDTVIKVWDLHENKLLQTVTMKFPSSMHGRMPDHGQFPICLLTIPTQCGLLVTCNDYIGQLNLGNTTKRKITKTTTHDSPLSCALYNQLFKQVVTGCDSSAVAVWDIETGSKAIVFSNAHGNEEITSMKFDASWRRLLTGARNGSIKNMYIRANIFWKGGQLHEDDISAMAFCPPNILATASYDGVLLIWNLETEKLLTKFKMPTTLEKVHFLCQRAAVLMREGATLISSGAGTLSWWNIYIEDQPLASCYIPESNDESVPALATNDDDEILLTGDTKGFIQVWNITDYCIRKTLTVERNRPKQLYAWKGHEGAVVSVEYVQHDADFLILSASVDKTAKLWTVDGRLVGIFGQKQLWSLKSLNSRVFDSNKNDSKSEMKPSPHIKIPIKFNSQKKDENIEAQVCLNSALSIKHVDCNSGSSSGPSVKSTPPHTFLQISTFQQNRTAEEEEEVEEEKEGKEEEEKENEEQQKVHFCFDSTENQRTFLGVRVAKDLARKKMDRRNRRQLYGAINTKQMARFGKICSPFQVLATSEVQEIHFPKSLNSTHSFLCVAMNESPGSKNKHQPETDSCTAASLEIATNKSL